MSHYRLLFPSEYLNACDLKGKDVPVTIESVTMEDVPDPKGEKKSKPVIRFKGAAKRMVLNKTCAKAIANKYGNDCDKWTGCKVVLYPTECQAFGQQVECVRIR